MKIVILDGYTENPGDLSWECLNTFGNVTVNAENTAELPLVTVLEIFEIFVKGRGLGDTRFVKRNCLVAKLSYAEFILGFQVRRQGQYVIRGELVL